MTDLLTTNTDWDSYLEDQSDLAKRMREKHWANMDLLMRKGRIPNWLEIDTLLQKDELRLMELIEERIGYVMGDPVTVQYGDDDNGLFTVPIVRHVDSLTHDAGFESAGNCRATVNRCIENGWIVRGLCEITGRARYDLTDRGRWVMDLVRNDAWFEEDDE